MLPSGVDGVPRTGGQTRRGSEAVSSAEEGREAACRGLVRGDIHSMAILRGRARPHPISTKWLTAVPFPLGRKALPTFLHLFEFQ